MQLKHRPDDAPERDNSTIRLGPWRVTDKDGARAKPVQEKTTQCNKNEILFQQKWNTNELLNIKASLFCKIESDVIKILIMNNSTSNSFNSHVFSSHVTDWNYLYFVTALHLTCYSPTLLMGCKKIQSKTNKKTHFQKHFELVFRGSAFP